MDWNSLLYPTTWIEREALIGGKYCEKNTAFNSVEVNSLEVLRCHEPQVRFRSSWRTTGLDHKVQILKASIVCHSCTRSNIKKKSTTKKYSFDYSKHQIWRLGLPCCYSMRNGNIKSNPTPVFVSIMCLRYSHPIFILSFPRSKHHLKQIWSNESDLWKIYHFN